MLKRLSLVAAMACAALYGTCAWADSVSDAVRAAEQKWAKNYNAKDLDGLMKGYTEDAMRLPPDTSRHQGRAAVRENLKKELDAGCTNSKLVVTDVGHSGNLAWLVGNFAVDCRTDSGEMAPATGNYVSVYRKEADGVWRLVIDTWNDTPPK